MIILAVDHCDPDICALEGPSRVEPPEPRTDNHHMRAIVYLHPFPTTDTDEVSMAKALRFVNQHSSRDKAALATESHLIAAVQAGSVLWAG